jgi:F0F1-type ATP synthase assembly protein I
MDEKGNRGNLTRYAFAGVEFVVAFALPLAGGFWLDGRLDTTPGFMLLGGAAGFALGLYRLIRQAKAGQRKGDDEGAGRC